MRILLTGADRPFGRALADHLAVLHELTAVGCSPDSGLDGYRQVDLRDEGTCAALVQGIETVIHATAFEQPPCSTGRQEQEALARATLGTYCLCTAARAAGVDRIIVIASLNVFDTLDPDWLVDEMWRPRPQPDMEHLAPFLCSETVHEFAREGAISGICLRFNPIGDDAEAETRSADALHAVDRALAMEFKVPGYRWHVFHVASSPRYIMRDAIRQLGFDSRGSM